jgi:ankyrin repeat protein
MSELLHQLEDIIAQRYSILDTLGQGGSGTTYQAEDLQSGERVALKALSMRHMGDWKAIALFEREAQVLAQLHHPAIPRYLEYFHVDTDSNRCFYIAQQLAQGQSLFTLVENGWHTSEEEVRHIAIQILEILVYLHGLTPPVIHRDIKPQNIIRRDDGQVFLVDFGAVQNTYHSTFARSSTVVGTFGYMAPEQFIGQAVPATDLYGLGATLLFLLTHRSPAELPTDGLKLDFRSRVQISDEFADWLEKMLEPDVEERFSSAKEALAVLQGKQMIAGKSRKSPRRKGLVNFGIAAVAALAVLYHFRYPILTSIGILPTQMYVAATWGDVDTVRHYLEQGVGANTRYIRQDTSGGTSLHLAGSKEVAQILIAHGADFNAKDQEGLTPLHTTRSPEVAQLLIAHGADVNARDNNGQTPLYWTSWKRSPEVAQLLIAHGADVNAKDYQGRTLLHEMRSPEVAQLLIDKGADVNARDKDGKTPLHETRSLEVAQLLIAKGADVNARDKDGNTPLHWAVDYYADDRKDLVELLLAKGAKVNAKDNQGNTPLHLTKSPQTAKVLIDNGADINAKEQRGRTPKLWFKSPLLTQLLIGKDTDLDVNARDKQGKTLLHLAAENGWKDKVELLLAKGADVNATDKSSGSTPLHLTRSPEVARLLIAKGANVKARNKYGSPPLQGRTPLHTAVIAAWNTNNKNAVELLIAQGADVNARDEYGQTPLHEARVPEVARLLIAKGANVNARNKYGMTPLHRLYTYSKNPPKSPLEVAKVLIVNGADVNAKDKCGETPLHKVGSLEAAKILIAHGASLNARDNEGNTPLHRAAVSDHTEVAQLLLANGADVNAKNNEGKTPVEAIIQDRCGSIWSRVLCELLG